MIAALACSFTRRNNFLTEKIFLAIHFFFDLLYRTLLDKMRRGVVARSQARPWQRVCFQFRAVRSLGEHDNAMNMRAQGVRARASEPGNAIRFLRCFRSTLTFVHLCGIEIIFADSCFRNFRIEIFWPLHH